MLQGPTRSVVHGVGFGGVGKVHGGDGLLYLLQMALEEAQIV